jgi:hypothetical protein
MKVRELPVAELIEDFDLYPRTSVESYAIASICDAMAAGAAMPPIVVCDDTKKIIDGLHRSRAKTRSDGPGATIKAEMRHYASDKERFLDAVKRNASHGVKLDTYDRAHCAIIAERLGIAQRAIAEVLQVHMKKYKDILKKRRGMAERSGRPIPLKKPLQHLEGCEFTEAQEEASKKLMGMHQTQMVHQVIILIENDLLDMENEALVERLVLLRDALNGLEGI